MKVLKFLDAHVEEILCVALLAMMSVIIFVQVVARYVFSNSLSWSEELARYMFIWCIYIGISYGVKRQKHISVEAAMLLFPKKVRPYLYVVSDILFFVFACAIMYFGWQVVGMISASGQTSPAVGIPMKYLYFAPVVGFFLCAIRLIQNIIETCKKIKSGTFEAA